MRDLLLLCFFQFLWSCSYAAMKYSMDEMPLGLVMIFRYGIGALTLAVITPWRGWRPSRNMMLLLLGIGVLNFTGSPWFQLTALTYTQASDVAVMVAFEPMIAAFLAMLLLREHLTYRALVAFVAATVGMLLMSDVQFNAEGVISSTRLIGNLIFFGAVITEGLFSVAGRFTVGKIHPLQMVTVTMLTGWLLNCAIYGPEHLTVENMQAITMRGWSALLFLGLGCSAFAYAGWVYLLKRIPVTQISLSLFLQPIFGGLVGYWAFGEVPTVKTFLGAGIIFASLYLWLRSYLQRQEPAEGPAQQQRVSNFTR